MNLLIIYLLCQIPTQYLYLPADILRVAYSGSAI